MSARVLWPLRRDEALAAGASALLFTLAFPPFPLLAPAFICLVPLAVAVVRAETAEGRGPAHGGTGSVGDAARLGFWFALLASAASFHWVANALLHFSRLALLGYVAAIVAAGIVGAAFAATLVTVRRRTQWPLAILLPVVWVAWEMVIAHLPEVAFPWLPVGLAMTGQLLLAQLADLSGVGGLSFLVALVNGLLADAWLARRDRGAVLRRAAAAAIVLGAAVGYGAWRMATITPRTRLRVATVQPNIAQDRKWIRENRPRILATMTRLTRSVPDDASVELIAWPEAALPDWIQHHPDWLDSIATVARETGTPVLFGALWEDTQTAGRPLYYNAALLTDANGRVTQPPTRKRHLVPLVERTPFVPPRRVAGFSHVGGFSRGGTVLLDHAAARIGTLICFESIFGERARDFRRRGADVLVNITNDAWFGRSLAPWQHEAHLVLRAIETRVGVVRAANTGFSGYVDPLGRSSGRTRLFEEAVTLHDVQTTDAITPYVRMGDWVGALCAVTVLALLAATAQGRRLA